MNHGPRGTTNCLWLFSCDLCTPWDHLFLCFLTRHREEDRQRWSSHHSACLRPRKAADRRHPHQRQRPRGRFDLASALAGAERLGSWVSRTAGHVVFFLMLTERGKREGPHPRAQGGSRPSAFFMSGGHSQQRDLGRRCSARGRGKVGGRGSGFINVLRAGALSAIRGEKESHRPWETEKGGGYPQSSQLRSAPNDSKPHNRVQVTAHLRRRGPRWEREV